MKYSLAYLCNTTSWGGLEMNQIRNAIWMRDRGHLVHVFVLQNSLAHQEAQKNNLQTIFVNKHKRHYDFVNAWRIARLMKALNIDFLLVRNNFDLSLAASVSFFSKRRIKTLYFMEMQLSFPKKQFFRTWRYLFIDAWCCPLQYLKKQVISNTKMNPVRIYVVPSGIDIGKIQIIDKRNARFTLNLKESNYVFGILGRIDPKKGQKLAVEAVDILKDERVNLLIMGEQEKNEHSDYLRSIKELIQKNELGEKVKIQPFSDSTELFFSAIDALIVPSGNETVGMVTIEALAHQIPVIGSNIGGTQEIVKDRMTGLLFVPNSAHDLADKMKIFLNQKINFDKQNFLESVKPFVKDKTCNLVEEIIMKLKN